MSDVRWTPQSVIREPERARQQLGCRFLGFTERTSTRARPVRLRRAASSGLIPLLRWSESLGFCKVTQATQEQGT